MFTDQSRPIALGVTLGVGVFLAAVFVLIASGFAPIHQGPASGFQSDASDDAFTIQARRRISIPFGIDSVAVLAADGQTIQASGHGTCPPDAGYFRLRVQVTQEGVPAPAAGVMTGMCTETGSITWSATAAAPGPQTFELGPANVCAWVVMPVRRSGAFTKKWCKDVNLVAPAAAGYQ